jgi:hypothetical protein
MPLLQMLQDGLQIETALQKAKGQVTEALRNAQQAEPSNQVHSFFESLHPHTALPTPTIEESA